MKSKNEPEISFVYLAVNLHSMRRLETALVTRDVLPVAPAQSTTAIKKKKKKKFLTR